MEKVVEYEKGAKVTRYCIDKELATQLKYANDTIQDIEECLQKFALNHDFDEYSKMMSYIENYKHSENTYKYNKMLNGIFGENRW